MTDVLQPSADRVATALVIAAQIAAQTQGVRDSILKEMGQNPDGREYAKKLAELIRDLATTMMETFPATV